MTYFELGFGSVLPIFKGRHASLKEIIDHSLRLCCQINSAMPHDYKTFFMLYPTEHKISTPHKNKNAEK